MWGPWRCARTRCIAPVKTCSYRRQLASVARNVGGTDEVGVTVSAGKVAIVITKGVALSTSGNGREWYDKEKWFGSDVNFVMFYVEAFSYMEVFLRGTQDLYPQARGLQRVAMRRCKDPATARTLADAG